MTDTTSWITTPDNARYDLNMLWSFRQIAIDDLKIPLCAPRQHQAVKTNRFWKGMTLYIGRSGVDQCALATVLYKYM